MGEETKYIRTKDRIYKVLWENDTDYCVIDYPIPKVDAIKQADTIEELLDEIVIIEEDGQEYPVIFFPDTYNAMIRRQEEEDYKGRLIGRIKSGLNKYAVAEWREISGGKYKGCYDWVLL